MAPQFSLSDIWFFGISVVALALVPTAFATRAWIFPAWFAGIGVYLLVAPAALHPAWNVWVWLLLSQGPWIALVPDLLSRGRAARSLDAVPLRSLLAFSLLHLLGARHVFSALSGDLPPDFALEIASGETLTAFGAGILWLFCRPEKLWFRLLAMFWNAQALTGSLVWSWALLRAHTGLPVVGVPSPDLHAYFGGWPGGLEAFFWIPLAVCLHAAVFYKLLRPDPDAPIACSSGEIIP